MTLHQLAPPALEPLTLDEAKQYLRVDHDLEDNVISGSIAAARGIYEDHTGRATMLAEWRAILPDFPRWGVLELPMPPLVEVLAIGYLDTGGAEMFWDPAEYRVTMRGGGNPSRATISPVGDFFPTARRGDAAVWVDFVAGYATPEEVPASVRAALLLLTGDLYMNREAQVVGTSTATSETLRLILQNHRLPVYA
jgi:uncharacterized phiE125 gp8 family phage protein